MPNLYLEADQKRRSGRPSIGENDKGRTAFQKDYARLLHAPAFRRLQGKTQLFPGAESDFFRNRLTHSLEVAQIATGIADVLNLSVNDDQKIDRDLVQFAAIAHDLGHPPFGHNGEHALDELMVEHGGFEGNAQTLRMLACTEMKLVKVGPNDFRNDLGLDLTYRTLAAILKYDNPIPSSREPGEELVKGYYASEAQLVAEIKEQVAPGYTGTTFKTLECGIMDIADDIAYSTYDLEDSLHGRFVTPMSLLAALFDENRGIIHKVSTKVNEALADNGYAELGEGELRAVAVSTLHFVPQNVPTHPDEAVNNALKSVAAYNQDQQVANDALSRTLYTAERVGYLIQSVELVPNRDFPALSKVRLNREALIEVELFKRLNMELVIRSPKLAVVQHRGKDIVKSVFNAIVERKGEFLSRPWKAAYDNADKSGQYRVICDFVAGMTDRYAVEMYDALFGEGKGLYGPI